MNIDPREVEICMRVLRQARQNLAANVGAFDSSTDLDAIIA